MAACSAWRRSNSELPLLALSSRCVSSTASRYCSAVSMWGMSAARAPSITALPTTAGRSRLRPLAVAVVVRAPGAAMQQVGYAVSDRGGDQQRRCRILVDVARHVIAGARALVVHRLRRRPGLVAGAVREILSGLADLGH